MSNSERICDLFNKDNLAKEDIKDAILGKYGDRCYNFISESWQLRVCMLSDKQIRWAHDIIETCILNKKPKMQYIRTGEYTFAPFNKSMQDKCLAHNKATAKYFKENVKVEEIDIETGEKVVKNDPKRGLFDPYFDRFGDDD